jgi:hypothetical protein
MLQLLEVRFGKNRLTDETNYVKEMSSYTWTTLGDIHPLTLTHDCDMWQNH